MISSVLTDGQQPPTRDRLRSALGPASAHWDRLLTLIADHIDGARPVWKFNKGWSVRVLHDARVLVYMTPQQGHFLVSMALGERAVAAAHAAKLPASVLQVIDSAPRYAEGRGVRIVVRTGRQVSSLARLAVIKHEN